MNKTMIVCSNDAGSRVWTTMGPEDAETLRRLRSASRRGRNSCRYEANRVSSRLSRVAAELEQITQSLSAEDAAELAAMASRLREVEEPKSAEPVAFQPAPGFTPKQLLFAWLRAAYEAGYTLQAMATVMEVTRQRAQQMVSAAEPVPDLPPIVGLPARDFLPWPTVPKPWHRYPRPTLTAEERERLVRLHKLGSQCRGLTPTNDPRRLASEEVTELMADLVERRGFKYEEVAEIVGVQKHSVRARLKMHGYKGGAAPSQKSYGRPHPRRKEVAESAAS